MAGILNQEQLGAVQQAVSQLPVANYSPEMANQSFGAGRFLMGQAPIPMEFSIPQQNYPTFPFTPGSFSEFKSGLSFADSKNPVIPVFNAATGRYESPAQKSLMQSVFGSEGSND